MLLRYCRLLLSVGAAVVCLGALLAGAGLAAAAPGPQDPIWLDGAGPQLYPVSLAANPLNGLIYVLNQQSGQVDVLSGTVRVQRISFEGARGCPYYTCLTQIAVNPLSGKVYVLQGGLGRLQIIAGAAYSGSLDLGFKSAAQLLAHPGRAGWYVLHASYPTYGLTWIDHDRVTGHITTSAPIDRGCVNPLNGLAYLTNGSSNRLWVYAGLSQTAAIQLPSNYAAAVACAPDGRVYVVSGSSLTPMLTVISGVASLGSVALSQSFSNWSSLGGDQIVPDPATGNVYVSSYNSSSIAVFSQTEPITRIALPYPTRLLVFTPTGALYASNWSGRLNLIRANQVVTWITTGGTVNDLAAQVSAGFVYLADAYNDTVTVVREAEVSATLRRPRSLALLARADRVYSANDDGTLSIIQNSAWLTSVAIGPQPRLLAADDLRVYVAYTDSASISILNNDGTVGEVGVGLAPAALAVYTPTQRLYVANAGSNTVSVLRNGQLESTLPVGGGPSALAVDPRTGAVYVANTVSGAVTLLQDAAVVGQTPVGARPDNVVFNPWDGYAYVTNALSRSISVLNGLTVITTLNFSAYNAIDPAVVDVDHGDVYVGLRGVGMEVDVLRAGRVLTRVTLPYGAWNAPVRLAVDQTQGYVYAANGDIISVISGARSLNLAFRVAQGISNIAADPAQVWLATQNPCLLRIGKAPPTLDSLSPTIIADVEKTTLSIQGDGYFLTPTVWLNDLRLENPRLAGAYSVYSGIALYGEVPANPPSGAYSLTLQTADGMTATWPNSLYIYSIPPAPIVISQVSPLTWRNDLTATVYFTGSYPAQPAWARLGAYTSTRVSIVDADTLAVEFRPGLPPGRYGSLFHDDAENTAGDLWRASGAWRRVYAWPAHSGGYAWQVQLTNTLEASLVISRLLDLRALARPTLGFWHKALASNNRALVEVAAGGGSWQVVRAFSPEQSTGSSWRFDSVDLADFSGQAEIAVRFRVATSRAAVGTAWNLDDVSVYDAAGGVSLSTSIDWQRSYYRTRWGLTGGGGSLTITNAVQRFEVNPARLEQAAGAPFTITIQARDVFSYPVPDFSGPVQLLAARGAISPAMAAGFVGGRLELPVQLDAPAGSVTITVTDGAGHTGVSAPIQLVEREAAAYLHLAGQNEAGRRFWVYADALSDLNHYAPAYTGVYTDGRMDAAYTPTVHTGATAIRVDYQPITTTPSAWTGAVWLDPGQNWSGASGGFNLAGARRLVFWAKGERGGEYITFGLGGVPSSAPRRSLAVSLSPDWRSYTLLIAPSDLERAVAGFFWSVNAADNPAGAVFYLDDVYYEYDIEMTTALYVYQDQTAANLFTPSGWMGEISQLEYSELAPDPNDPHNTITRWSYKDATSWAGAFYLWPENNWGTQAQGGRNLSGALRLKFRARGEAGGEVINFGMGGVTGVYSDTSLKRELTQVVLKPDWREYTLDLTGANLSRVVGGFYWSTNQANAAFYLDDIRYEFAAPTRSATWPHFLPGYAADLASGPQAAPLYDNALAVLAFVARGAPADLAQARSIADAMLYAQQHDPDFADGRLRNVYRADLLIAGDHRAVFWNDAYGAGSGAGNLGWAILALTRVYSATGQSAYLTAAVRLGEWLQANTYDERPYGGYRGGYEGWAPHQTPLDWKSTPDNVTLAAAFQALRLATGDGRWAERAGHAQAFVQAMWQTGALEAGAAAGWFWPGTRGNFTVYADGENPVTEVNACRPAPVTRLPYNHYYLTTFGPDPNQVQFDPFYTGTLHAGAHSLHLAYAAGAPDWAGLIGLEGPANGGPAGPGYDLSRASALTVWMKGAQGGEKIVIGLGGAPYSWLSQPISTTLPGAYAAALSQTISLTADWQPYTLTLSTAPGLDLQHLIGGFFAYFTPADSPNGAEVFIDEIVYRFDDEAREAVSDNLSVSANALGLLGPGPASQHASAAAWIQQTFRLTETAAGRMLTGYDFDADLDGIWLEGSLQTMLAFQKANQWAWYDQLLPDLEWIQRQAPRANAKGIVSALHDCLSTGQGWYYFNRLQVAPTAWYIFIQQGYDPYSGQWISRRIYLPVIRR